MAERIPGVIVQKDKNYRTIRVVVPLGELDVKTLPILKEISEKYSTGILHLSTRQGIEIPFIKKEELNEALARLTTVGLSAGSSGTIVRNVMACPGLPSCQFANIDTKKLARMISDKYGGHKDLPAKFKIAVTGCPNSCAKPQINDYGVAGVVLPKISDPDCIACGACVQACKEKAISIADNKARINYDACVHCGDCIRTCPQKAILAEKEGNAVYFGGNVGRHVRVASKLVEFVDNDEVMRILGNLLTFYKEYGTRRERFGATINRVGVGKAATEILKAK